MSCSADSCAKSLKLCKDGVGGSGPGEGLAILVVVSDEFIDARDQLLDRTERSAANRLVSDEPEEALDLVQP